MDYGWINFIFKGGLVIPKRKLFDEEYISDLDEKFDLDWYNIYFFGKTPKAIFKTEDTRVIKNVGVYFTYIYGKKTETISVYKTDLIKTNQRRWGVKIPHNFDVNNATLELDKNHTNSSELVFQLKDKQDKIVLRQGIEELDGYLNFKPEVIYIGKSKEIVKRLRNHSTLQKAYFSLKENEQLKLYLTHFTSGYGPNSLKARPNLEIVKLNLSSPKILNESYKIKYSLLERILINFFQPEYNIQHMKTELNKDELIKEELIKKDVKCVAINLDTGKYTHLQFWSKNQKSKSKTVSFNFDNPHKGFQSNYEGIRN